MGGIVSREVCCSCRGVVVASEREGRLPKCTGAQVEDESRDGRYRDGIESTCLNQRV